LTVNFQVDVHQVFQNSNLRHSCSRDMEISRSFPAPQSSRHTPWGSLSSCWMSLSCYLKLANTYYYYYSRK